MGRLLRVTARYLVFGAGGHIGGPAARALIAKRGAAAVRVASSRAAGAAGLSAQFPESEAVHADLLDPTTLDAAVAGIAAVFVVNPDFFDDRAAAQNLIDAAARTRQRPHIVRLQAEVPGMTLDTLPGRLRGPGPRRGHLEARAAIEASRLPATFLNSLAYFMDDFTRHFAPALRTGHRLIVPFERPMCFIDTDDLGAAAAAVMLAGPDAHGGCSYNLNSGEDGIAFRDVAKMIAAVTGVPIAYEPDPDVFSAELGAILNQISGRDDALAYLLDDWRMEQAHPGHYVGNGNLEMLLGRQPRNLHAWLTAHRDILVERPPARPDQAAG